MVAVPVGPPETCDELGEMADRVVCPRMPSPFFAIGLWYESFPQLTDAEVCALMESAQPDGAAAARA